MEILCHVVETSDCLRFLMICSSCWLGKSFSMFEHPRSVISVLLSCWHTLLRTNHYHIHICEYKNHVYQVKYATWIIVAKIALKEYDKYECGDVSHGV